MSNIPTNPNTLPHDYILEKGFVLIGNSYWSLAIPKNTPDELRMWLFATYTTYLAGYHSVDSSIRRLNKTWPVEKQNSDSELLLNDILAYIRSTSSDIVGKRILLNGLPDHVGLVAAGAALIRLDVSYKSAALLCDMGLSFESFAIQKLILEQIAWACSVHKIKDKSIFKVQPSAAITKLKIILPYVGNLYGKLNEHAHIDPRLIHTLMDFKQNNAEVIIRSQKQAILAALNLALLIDCYGVAMEHIYFDWYDRFDYITKSNNIALKKRRQSMTVYNRFRKRVLKLMMKNA